MPINLRYGQRAVELGFINQQRLQQVLTKQRQLAEQGKKVSVRMILEKSKLLTPDQIAAIDDDLNIKVVTKRTGGVSSAPKADPPKAAPPPSMQAGTMYSPPPPDMQERIRAERERAKQEAQSKQESQAGFLDRDDEGLADDPFAEDQGAELAPEPIGDDHAPHAGPASLDAELSPEPDAMSDDLSPEPMGFGSDEPEPAAPPRQTGSAPVLSSLGGDMGMGDDEDLPSVSPFDEEEQHPPAWGEPEPPKPEWGPPQQELSPSRGAPDFGDDDIRSPEELEAGAGASGTRPLGGSLDKTMFSPPPPGMKEAAQAARRKTSGPPPQAAPEPDNWGEEALDDDSPFADEARTPEDQMDATRLGGMAPPAGQGRHSTDDFAGAEFPDDPGRKPDDVPTAQATGDEVHPLRRGVGTSSSTVSKRPARRTDRIAHEEPEDAFEALQSKKDKQVSGRDPADDKKTSKPLKRQPHKKSSSKKKAGKGGKGGKDGEKKGTSRRVLLLFVILLLIVVAILVLPVALFNHVPWVEQWRDHPTYSPVFDHVEDIYQHMPWYVPPIRDTGADPVIPDPGPLPPADSDTEAGADADTGDPDATITEDPAESVPEDPTDVAPPDNGSADDEAIE
jgi:hypothetical protein